MIHYVDLFGSATAPHVDVVRRRVRPYPAEPGSGPPGETCGTCRRHVTLEYAKRYHKCALTKTNSAVTDIRVSSPACRWFLSMPKD